MTDGFSCLILTETLKQVLNSVLAITEEGRLVVDETGFKVNAADLANIGMVSISVGKKLFLEYGNRTEPSLEATEVGVDFEKLYQIVQLINEPSIGIGFDSAKVSLKAGGYDYSLAQLEASTLKSDPKVPTLEFPINVTIPTSELQRAFKAASKLRTDNIVLGVQDKVLYMHADNGIGDKLELSLKGDNIQGLEEAVENCSSRYNLQYLARMVKGVGHVSDVMLRLCTDYPLAVEFSLGPEGSFVKYLIAPRIEESFTK